MYIKPLTTQPQVHLVRLIAGQVPTAASARLPPYLHMLHAQKPIGHGKNQPNSFGQVQRGWLCERWCEVQIELLPGP